MKQDVAERQEGIREEAGAQPWLQVRVTPHPHPPGDARTPHPGILGFRPTGLGWGPALSVFLMLQVRLVGNQARASAEGMIGGRRGYFGL